MPLFSLTRCEMQYGIWSELYDIFFPAFTLKATVPWVIELFDWPRGMSKHEQDQECPSIIALKLILIDTFGIVFRINSNGLRKPFSFRRGFFFLFSYVNGNRVSTTSNSYVITGFRACDVTSLWIQRRIDRRVTNDINKCVPFQPNEAPKYYFSWTPNLFLKLVFGQCNMPFLYKNPLLILHNYLLILKDTLTIYYWPSN